MSKKRSIAAKLAAATQITTLTKEVKQLTDDLANQQKNHELQINSLLREVGLANELDILQHTALDDMKKLIPFANKIKKKWIKAVQQITGQPTRTVTKADLGSEIMIPAEERKWYSIQEEAPNRSITNARYRVISQGLIVGDDLIEQAVVARISDS